MVAPRKDDLDKDIQEIIGTLNEHDEEDRVRGYVLEYDELEQTGLIDLDDYSEKIFFHIDDLRTDDPQSVLQSGDRVEINVEETDKGLQARAITRIEK